jgi:hypothetical protein
MTGREYGALLHEAAAFFDSHPDLPVPDVHGSVAVLYELRDENARKLLKLVQKEGFTPQVSSMPDMVLWERRCGRGSLCFILPRGDTGEVN